MLLVSRSPLVELTAMGGGYLFSAEEMGGAVAQAVTIGVGPVLSGPYQLSVDDVQVDIPGHRVVGAVEVLLNENNTWFTADGLSTCAGDGMRQAAAAAVASALGLSGGDSQDAMGMFSTKLLEQSSGNRTNSMPGAAQVLCPGVPVDVHRADTSQGPAFAVRYEFITETMTRSAASEAVRRLRLPDVFSANAVGAINRNALRGFTATTRAMAVSVDFSVTSVDDVASVRVRTPEGTSEEETNNVVVRAVQDAIDLDRVSQGLRSAHYQMAGRADVQCAQGACPLTLVQFAQSPPSPPPPASVRTEGTIQFDGFTAATFTDAQQRVFEAVIAGTAEVDPAAVSVLQVEDRYWAWPAAAPTRRRALLQTSQRQVCTENCGIVVLFAIDSFGGSEADDVQARLTRAEQSGDILNNLRSAPAFAAASITRASGVVGTFSVVTPPMPPPAAAAPGARAASQNFDASYAAGGYGCDGQVELNDQGSSGSLTDGTTSAQLYLDGLLCEWLIGDGEAPFVSIRFTRFATEYGYDFVEVFDGRDTERPSLGRFSGVGSYNAGPSLPNNGAAMNSTQPFLLVRFTTDAANRDRGFALDWTLAPPPASPPPPPDVPPGGGGGGGALLGQSQLQQDFSGAGAMFAPDELPKDHCQEPVLVMGDGGEVGDGSLPAVNYLNHANCIWLIRSTRSRLKLHFTRFDTENDYDVLTVYSADSFDDVEGLQSNAAAAEVLRSQYSDDTVAVLTGSSLPVDIISTGEMLALVFTSDGSVQHQGFAATWEATDADPERAPEEAANAPCVGPEGAVLTDANGTISDGPGNYEDDASCTWTVVPPEGSGPIRLEFTSVDMESNYDYLKVFRKAASTGELTLIKSMTGNLNSNLPSPLVVQSGDSLVIKLTSDGSVHNTGFSATYREATEEEVDGAKADEHSCFDAIMNGDETGVDCGGSCDGPCGGTCSGTVIINATTPAVTSGTFTDGSGAGAEYDNNRRCNFVIIAPPSKLVVVSFTRLDVEDGYDYLFAFDSEFDGTQPNPADFMLGRFSGPYDAQRLQNMGQDAVGYVISSGPRLALRFESDGSVASSGFEARWELRDGPDVDGFELDVASASVMHAALGLVIVMMFVLVGGLLANYKMARKNQQYSRQIIARTGALKDMHDDDHRLLEDDLESFPLEMKLPVGEDSAASAELRDVDVAVVSEAKKPKPRGLVFPGQSPR